MRPIDSQTKFWLGNSAPLRRHHPVALALGVTLLMAVIPLGAQTGTQAVDGPTNVIDKPRDVTYCELARDPAAYNRRLVRLTAFVTHGFENFNLSDPSCPTEGFSVWVMHGGNAPSDTMYCCPGEVAGKTRPAPLTVEGVQIPLVADSIFTEFTDLLRKEADTTVRLTAVGRFFSGTKQTVGGQTRWGDAGHLGCCSLFAVQSVESFEPHTRSDVEYSAEAGWNEEEGCEYGQLDYLKHVAIAYPDREVVQAIAEQRKADSREAEWRFTDPQRVAVESLTQYYPDQRPVLRTVRRTSARHVFHWRRGRTRVIVVVTRPYWLSFYAKSRSVVWVSTMIKEARCK